MTQLKWQNGNESVNVETVRSQLLFAVPSELIHLTVLGSNWRHSGAANSARKEQNVLGSRVRNAIRLN